MKKIILAVALSSIFAFSACAWTEDDSAAQSGSDVNSSWSGTSSDGNNDSSGGSSSDSSSSNGGNTDSSSGGSSSDSSSGGSDGGDSSSDSGSDSSGGGDSSSDSGSDSSDGGSDCKKHVDVDGNDYCDGCGDSVAVTFDIFSLNDLHGKFEDTTAQIGVDELTTYLKQTKAENPNTVILSSGDMWQGSPESNVTRGEIITEWMNDVGFVSMTLGNHEYDWGEEYIESNSQLANFPFLGINIYDGATGQRVPYCQPSVTVEKNGVKIGVIGAIGDCLSSISGDMVGTTYFKTGSELTALVKAEAQKLRAEGADCIVYSLHGDFRNDSGEYDVSLSDGYVDLVFEGHTHQAYAQKDANGVYHIQNKGDNGGVAHAEITVNYVNDTSAVKVAESLTTGTYENYADDPIVDSLMEKYDDVIAPVMRTLGKNDAVRQSDEILDICAELYYEAGVARWGEEYDLVLGGAYLKLRAPYKLNVGTVIYGDLMNILPFDNPLVLCSIKGSDLRQKFLETTNADYHIYCGEYGESVRDNLDEDKTYYLITDTYTSTYAPNNLTEIERYDEGIFARDLLADYIQKGGFTTQVTETSISQIITIGNALADNETTTVKYRVRGTVTSIVNTTYGNLYIEDENGNSLYVYGVYDENGNRYDGISNPPQVGD